MFLQRLNSNTVTHLTATVNHHEMRLRPEWTLMYPPKIANSLNFREKQAGSLISRTKSETTRVWIFLFQIQTYQPACQVVCCSELWTLLSSIWKILICSGMVIYPIWLPISTTISHEICIRSTEVKLEVTCLGAFGWIQGKETCQMHQVDSRKDHTEKDSSSEVLMLLKQQIQESY